MASDIFGVSGRAIPGTGPVAAALIIAEIGLDMARFPSPGTWPRGRSLRPGSTLRRARARAADRSARQPDLARVLGKAAVATSRTNTFLGARYRRIARRRGKKKAIVAVGRSLLVVIWHVLADPETRFIDLGPDHFDRHVDTAAKKRNHARQLESLGYRVTIEPAA